MLLKNRFLKDEIQILLHKSILEIALLRGSEKPNVVFTSFILKKNACGQKAASNDGKFALKFISKESFNVLQTLTCLDLFLLFLKAFMNFCCLTVLR